MHFIVKPCPSFQSCTCGMGIGGGTRGALGGGKYSQKIYKCS